MDLHNLPKRKKRQKKAKRIGRGYGSGRGGHTVGKGMKGQKSRSGYGKGPGWEGGDVPLYRRLPKFPGFRNPTRKEYAPVNLDDIETHYKDGEEVSVQTLKQKGLVKKKMKSAKILARGDISKKLVFAGVAFSKKAREKVEKAGGEVK
jgi:large subunit ribosomal protein L15